MASTLSLAPVREMVVARSGDDVYARLILSMLGNIQVRGLALASPLEAALGTVAPGLLAPSSYLAQGDWMGLVFTAGSSAVGVQMVQMIVNLAMVTAGAAVLAGLGARSWQNSPRSFAPAWPLLPGVVCLTYGAGAELRLRWSSGSGGEMALSMVATKLLGIQAGAYDAALQHGRLVSLAVNVLALGIALAVGTAAALVFVRLSRRQTKPGRVPVSMVPRVRAAVLSASSVLALLCASVSPAVAFEKGHSTSLPSPKSGARLQVIVSKWPSVVTITARSDGKGWDYRVNGRRDFIRGIGYNAVTIDETPQQRAARYDRDFASISAAGANMIVGWSEREFDDLLMQKAAEHGLGVLLPFQLGPDYIRSGPNYAYEDPQVRQMLMQAITRRVERYRNSPALRMWGLGNEVLHALAWAHASQIRSDAFAQFLIEAADRVHELDPNHPIVYRDAEDWYVKPIIRALAANPKPRPWFVYSMNFFTTRMRNALATGPTSTMEQPLMISEFGPVGLRAAARPDGYRQLWDIIRSYRGRVLGGSAYVWTTAGPEPLDRNFGLTDADGQPVDGSLSELAALYLNDREDTSLAPSVSS